MIWRSAMADRWVDGNWRWHGREVKILKRDTMMWERGGGWVYCEFNTKNEKGEKELILYKTKYQIYKKVVVVGEYYA